MSIFDLFKRKKALIPIFWNAGNDLKVKEERQCFLKFVEIILVEIEKDHPAYRIFLKIHDLQETEALTKKELCLAEDFIRNKLQIKSYETISWKRILMSFSHGSDS